MAILLQLVTQCNERLHIPAAAYDLNHNIEARSRDGPMASFRFPAGTIVLWCRVRGLALKQLWVWGLEIRHESGQGLEEPRVWVDINSARICLLVSDARPQRLTEMWHDTRRAGSVCQKACANGGFVRRRGVIFGAAVSGWAVVAATHGGRPVSFHTDGVLLQLRQVAERWLACARVQRPKGCE